MTIEERVSEATRTDARRPVGNTWERLSKERDRLASEMRDVDAELSTLSAQRKKGMAKAYRGDRKSLVATTYEVGAQFDERRGELIRRKQAIQAMFSDINAKLSTTRKPSERPNDNLVLLIRIESVLIEILKQLKSGQ